jgi:uncharacterized protein
MAEMFVYRVALDVEQGLAVVVLTDEPQELFLPIWIGLPEARAIAMELHGESPPRPYTHDLMASIIGHVGYRLERVTITDLKGHTFYALLTLVREGETVEVDARPSDSIALALRTDAPIFVADEVMTEAVRRPESEGENDDVQLFQQLMSKLRLDAPEAGEGSE